MKIDDLKKKQVVTKDGHFMPIVFVDLSIPTAAVAAGCTYAGKEINRKINATNFPLPQIGCNLSPYTSISTEKASLRALALSVDDITY